MSATPSCPFARPKWGAGNSWAGRDLWVGSLFNERTHLIWIRVRGYDLQTAIGRPGVLPPSLPAKKCLSCRRMENWRYSSTHWPGYFCVPLSPTRNNRLYSLDSWLGVPHNQDAMNEREISWCCWYSNPVATDVCHFCSHTRLHIMWRMWRVAVLGVLLLWVQARAV